MRERERRHPTLSMGMSGAGKTNTCIVKTDETKTKESQRVHSYPNTGVQQDEQVKAASPGNTGEIEYKVIMTKSSKLLLQHADNFTKKEINVLTNMNWMNLNEN